MIEYKIINEAEEAEKLWKYFSSDDEIYDLWIARSIYNDLTKSPIHFICGFDNNVPVLLLPLQWNEQENSLEIFGGRFFSLNKVFAKPGFEKYYKDLFKQIDKPLFLRWLSHPIPDIATKKDDGMYILYRNDMEIINDYYDNYFQGERKKKIKKYIRQINDKKPAIHFNRQEDYETLVDFNIKKFGDKSLFKRDALRTEFFRRLITKVNSQIISIELNGEIVGVGYRILHNNKILGINTGINPKISNIGKYLYINAIQTMIDNRYDSYNALEGDYGWKDIYGFTLLPQYQLNNLEEEQSDSA